VHKTKKRLDKLPLPLSRGKDPYLFMHKKKKKKKERDSNNKKWERGVERE
jgi:hypothetical protein